MESSFCPSPRVHSSKMVPFICALAGSGILPVHSTLAASAPQSGATSFIEPPKRFPNAIEVIAIDLAKLGGPAAVINRPDLIEADIFILTAKADMHVTTSPHAAVCWHFW